MIMHQAFDDYSAPLLGSKNAGNDFDEGGFARTIFADQTVDFTGLHRPINAFKRDGAAKPLANIFKTEEWRTRRAKGILFENWRRSPHGMQPTRLVSPAHLWY